MKRSCWLLAVLLTVLASCGPADSEAFTTAGAETTTTSPPAATTIVASAFPVTIQADNGPVTIDRVVRGNLALRVRKALDDFVECVQHCGVNNDGIDQNSFRTGVEVTAGVRLNLQTKFSGRE